MAIELAAAAATAALRPDPRPRCRNCGTPEAIGPELRLRRLLRSARGRLRPRRWSAGSSRPTPSPPGRPGIWRYLELLPVDAAARARPARSAARRWSRADRLGAVDRRRRPADQGRHPQPDALVQGPRRRDRRRPPRRPSASRRSAARARATSPARRPRPRRPSACPPTCSCPPTSSRPRSSTRSPTARPSCRIDGTYDDVNRLCLEVADELPWGLVNVNLRPFYAEGSKTLGYEIAEDLGWRLPGRRRRPDRLGRDGHPPRAGVRGAGRARLGRAEGRSGSSAARPPAARRSRRRSPPAARTSSRSGRRTRSCARWRSATPPTGATRSSSRGRPRGSIEAIADDADGRRDPADRDARGHLHRDRGRRDDRRGRGRAPAGRDPRRRRGRRAAHRQRAQDARRRPRSGSRRGPPSPGGPGLTPVIPARFSRVRRLAVGMSQVRIPPVLRTSAGGQKLIEVEGATVGEALERAGRRLPGPRPAPARRRGRHQPVRERVRERDRRPPPPGRSRRRSADATRSCCCRRWPAADAGRSSPARERRFAGDPSPRGARSRSRRGARPWTRARSARWVGASARSRPARRAARPAPVRPPLPAPGPGCGWSSGAGRSAGRGGCRRTRRRTRPPAPGVPPREWLASRRRRRCRWRRTAR